MSIDERINDSIDKKLKEVEESKRKVKKFRLPFGTKVSKGQAKKNYITMMKINDNSQVTFKKIQIDDQTIMENKIPRLATTQHIVYFKKNPMIILPSWSVRPFSPAEHYEKSLNDGSNTKGYALLLAKMQKEMVSTKKEMSGLLKWGFGIVILGIIAYAFLSGGI